MSISKQHFPTWGAFVSQVSRPATVPERHAQSGQGSAAWTWTETFADALVLAKTGWRDGFKAISAKADSISRAIGGESMTPRYADAGDEVDVGLFLEGEPEHFIEYPLEPQKRPVVKFVVSISFSCSVSAEAIYNRGAAVLAAIDALEASGVRCEVELDCSTGANTDMEVRVGLKAASDALDRDKLAFALCHPSTLRRLKFRLHEQRGNEYWRQVGGGGYGMPKNPAREAGAIILPCMTSGDGFYTLEQATASAEAMIAQAVKLVE